MTILTPIARRSRSISSVLSVSSSTTVSVISSSSRKGEKPFSSSAALTAGTGPGELHGGQVHRQFEMCWPCGRIAASSPQHPFADGRDQADLLRERDELA